MNQEQPFLDAIAEAPEHDGPRLVYADWLDEQGQTAQAEFVRVQLQLARLTADDSGFARLQAREKELYYQHRDAWTAPLKKLGVTAWFRRGVVNSVQISATRFLKNAEKIFQLAPFIDSLYVGSADKFLESLAVSPYLARLTHLGIGVSVRGAQARILAGGLAVAVALAKSPHLANLRSLGLATVPLSDAGLAALAQSSAFAHLETLDLRFCRIGPSGLAALGQSQHLTGLTTLWLEDNPLGDAGVAALAGSSNMARLRSLDLYNTEIADEAMLAIAASPHLAALETLCIHGRPRPGSFAQGNRVTAPGLAALAASTHLGSLKRLDVSENPVGDDGVRALAQSQILSQLTRLNLQATNATKICVLALSRAKGLNHLEELNLGSNNGITDDALAILLRHPELGNLKSLDVSSTQAGDETAIALASCPHLGKLKSLNLGHLVTQRGLKALVHSSHLPALREVWLLGSGYDSGTEQPDPMFQAVLTGAAASETDEDRTQISWFWPEITSYVRRGQAPG